MKKLLYFSIAIFSIIVILPAVIVLGFAREKEGHAERQIVMEEIKRSVEEENKIELSGKQKGRENISISVYLNEENKIVQMPLEEYVKGVVAAEMPVDFEMEALKAQAAAARTYAYGRFLKLYTSDRHPKADVCTSVHCQAWKGKERAMEEWGEKFSERWERIERAVLDTEDMVIVYDNTVINPLYHSNSGGRTENIQNVWSSQEVPYLKSVFSASEEAGGPEFKDTVKIKEQDFIKALKKSYKDIKINEKDVAGDIKILSRSEGGRVLEVKVGSKTLKGTEFREIFSLNSANFSIKKENDGTLAVTTLGNGHGVGMSQWGANSLAQEGSSFSEIIMHYYTGTGIKSLYEIK